MDKTDAYNVIDEQITLLFEKPLSANSVDLLYKLTSIQRNISEGLYGANTKPHGYSSNGKYDRNINELLDSYILARKSGDIPLIEDSLSLLLAEISDLIVEIYNTAVNSNERRLISDSIQKMIRH